MTPYFLYFMFFLMLFEIGLILYRWPFLRSKTKLGPWTSKDFAILVGSILLLLVAFIVLWGTMLPKLTESPHIRDMVNAISGTLAHILHRPFFPMRSAMHVKPAWFSKTNAPIAIIILLGAFIGPALQFGKTPTKFRVKRLIISAIAGFIFAIIAAIITVLYAARISESHVTTLLHEITFMRVLGFITLWLTLSMMFFALWDFTATVRVLKKTKGLLNASIFVLRANSRHYGGMFAHILLGITFVGFFGSTIGSTKDKIVLQSGRFVESAGHIFAFAGLTSRFSASESFGTLTSNIVVTKKDQHPLPSELTIKGHDIAASDEGPYLVILHGAKDKELWASLYASTVLFKDLKVIDHKGTDVTIGMRDRRVLKVLPEVVHRYENSLIDWATQFADVTIMAAQDQPMFKLSFSNKALSDAFVDGLTHPVDQVMWTGLWGKDDLIVMIKDKGMVMRPEMRFYTYFDQATSEVSIDYGVFYNIYIASSGAKGADLAGLTIMVTPLASFVFLSTLLMLLWILVYKPLKSKVHVEETSTAPVTLKEEKA